MSSNTLIEVPSWSRVRLRLRNTCAGGDEHLHHIIHAILFGPAEADSGANPWCWRPACGWIFPTKPKLGQSYDVYVFFARMESAVGFGKRISASQIRHFHLDDIRPPEMRSLRMLESESPEPDWTANEIRLDFLTPLVWEKRAKATPAERWRLDTHRLARLLDNRLNHFLGIKERSWETNFPDFEVHASHLRRTDCRQPHRSKSSGSERMLDGLEGPIYLSGDWQAAWTQLLLCQELQLGSNTTIGQGSFRLLFARMENGG